MSDHNTQAQINHQNSAVNPMAAKANTTIAYTDGACKGNPGMGGWGAHLIFSDGTTQDLYGGAQATTNNRMELMGAIKALQYSPHEVPLEIWTDSSYVKKGITEWIDGWKSQNWRNSSKKPVANQDLWQQLDTMRQARTVSWHWVKGHAGHVGNEKADALANLGVTANHEYDNNDGIKNDDTKKKESTMTSSTQILAADDWLNYDPLGLGDDDIVNSDDVLGNSDTFDNNDTAFENEAHTNATKALVFDGDTSGVNPHFQPLLPKSSRQPNRQLVMDTETTGLDALKGDRIIEVGIVEMINRKLTGEKLHVYINPQRGMDEVVIRIHGISEAFLTDKPTFDKVAKDLYDFMDGAEIIAHNATFDMSFLTMEFDKVGMTDFAQRVKVTDSLIMAKQQYPGQKNTLDALVKRLNVGKQDRTFHGALLDSEILAEVYLAMTGGQVALAIEEDVQADGAHTAHANFATLASLLLTSTEDSAANQTWFTGLAETYPALKTHIT